jgi:hypothetical protein
MKHNADALAKDGYARSDHRGPSGPLTRLRVVVSFMQIHAEDLRMPGWTLKSEARKATAMNKGLSRRIRQGLSESERG